MAVAGEVSINVTARVGELERNLKRGARAVREFQRDADGSLKKLKGIAGEESTIGGIGKMLRGAGAVAGVTMAADAIGKLTEKFIDLRDRMREGKIGWYEAVNEGTRALPVLGSIYHVFDRIGELVTGNEHLNKTILEGAERTNALLDQQLALRKAILQVQEDMGRAVGEIQSDRAISRAKPPFQDWLKAQKEFIRGMDDAEKKKDAALKLISESTDWSPQKIAARRKELTAYINANREAEARTKAAWRDNVGVYGGKELVARMDAARNELSQLSVFDKMNQGRVEAIRGFNALTIENLKTLGYAFYDQGVEFGKKLKEGISSVWNARTVAQEMGINVFKDWKQMMSTLLFSSPAKSAESAGRFADRTAAAAEKLRDRLSAAAASYKRLTTTPATEIIDNVKQMGELLAAGKISAFQYAGALGRIAGGGQDMGKDASIFGTGLGLTGRDLPTVAAREFRFGSSTGIPDTAGGSPQLQVIELLKEQRDQLKELNDNLSGGSESPPVISIY